jgi:fumarate reductase subunit C
MSPDHPSRADAAGYTAYHPRWFRKRVSTYWWLHQWSYLKFVLRELSSIFVAWFVVLTLIQIRAISHGPEAYAQFLSWMKNPWLILLNAVSLLFILFHMFTWFGLAPRAMALRVGGKRVPEVLFAVVNYSAWFVISGVLAWFLMRGLHVE